MESIIWFLVIGALFYFMMRFGCGAHMGGHGRHGGGHEGHTGHGEEASVGSKTAKDPVCGMEIDKDQAFAMTRREGRQFYLVIDHVLAPVLKVSYGPKSLLQADL